MGKLNSRQLTRKVRLQRKSLTRDAYGQPLDSWTTYATVRAAPRVQTGMGYVNNEMQQGGTEVSRTTTSYRIRKRTNVIAADRLLDGSNIYDIRVVLPDLEDNNYVDLGCATGAAANGVNSAPVITSNSGGSTASISIPEGTTAVTTVVATDADGVLTYSISGGADAAKFTINSSTGVLRFVSAPDYETPLDVGGNNVYEVTVKATDLFGSTDTQAISVTVTAVNDIVPAITSNGGGATAAISVEEAQTAVTTVTSADADGPTAAYTIVGGADAALFELNAGSGVLTFADAPDFSAPGDADANNVYEVTVQVSDGTNTDTQAISVTVTEAVSSGYWPGAVINAASASYADVSAAVASASAGDTVIVPASAGVSWSSGLTISGINFVGAGQTVAGTVVTAGLITVVKHATYKTRVSGLRMTANAQHLQVNGAVADEFYFIDNCYLQNAGALMVQVATNGGCWFDCNFEAPTPHSADTFQLILGAEAAASWAAAHTMGTADTTGEANNYFEDCTWSGFLEVAGDIDNGAKAVYRNCTFTDSSLVVHGGNSGVNDTSAYGGRHLEVYDCTFDRVSNDVGLNKWVWWRGSSGVFANNSVENADSPDGFSYPGKPELILSCGCTGSPAYPMQYQVGQSTDTPDATPGQPLAIFGNTGVSMTISISGTSGGGITCGLPGDYIQSGRDYVLSNTWGWAAYAYPHPLRAGI
jgi:SPP1 family predicted phage head-tail adaptor